MRIVGKGTVFASELGSDHQSCAYGQVEVLPGGRWLAGCRAADTKGGNEGEHVLLSASDDEGKSWSPAVSPFTPPVLDGRPGHFRGIGLTALGGTRVLATLYWVDMSDPSLPFFNEETEGLLGSFIMFAESEDGGSTWSEPTLMDTTPFNVPCAITGPVRVFPDGERMCHFETNKTYYDTTKWTHSSVMMFSRDGGRTWPRYSVVTRHPTIFYWDQRPSILPDGRVFDLFWTYDNAAAKYLNIHANVSSDRGQPWSGLWDTGVPGQPAPPVALRDGRLAMVYVDREGPTAIRCRVSSDDGRTWPDDSVLNLYESGQPGQTVKKGQMADAWSEMGKFSVGLPATAALPNGDILVLYYAGPETDRTNVEWMRLRDD
jgi:hypothetical protein